MPTFTHLNLHSEYSITDSTIRISALTALLKKTGMTACALTDQHNLFAAIKFYKACEKAGIKPILGADVLIKHTLKPHPFRLTLLCMSMTGYRSLTRLISRAYIDKHQQHAVPVIDKKWLDHLTTQDLIALCGGQDGDIGQALLAKQPILADTFCAEWMALFPDRFYLTLHRTGKPAENFYNQSTVMLAEKYALPVVAVNHVRFLTPDDFDAHEARVCIQAGWVLNDPKRPKAYTPEQYLKSAEAMANLFADIPEAIDNANEIAKRCNLIIPLGELFLPKFPVPKQALQLSLNNFFKQTAETGLQTRFAQMNLDSQQKTLYNQRLATEISVITQMHFADYFLIVADFIAWAKNNHIPVGPGRGSGAGSLVAYALQITDIDPLPYGLVFERFLNPERVSMPDFDIDFCMEGRDRVIDYVAEKYGRESVSQIITFGTMAAKAVVRDVGRILGHPYGYVDKLAKLIPFELNITLDKALKQEKDLSDRYQKEEEVNILIDLAKKLEGLIRNAGKHAGGIVIAPTRLTDFTPLYTDDTGTGLVSQFDKDDIETVGLVKFDFLGLRTLTIIAHAVKTINQHKLSHALFNIQQIPIDDPTVYQLIKTGQTTALFQLESRGMKELVKKLQPDCFEEIVALVALFRPGPLQSGMVDDFIQRKHGKNKITYLHALLEPILKETYGVILYQEQVMQIAQVLAGYTLGQADILRKAMGKKKPEEMAKQRLLFIQGAFERHQVPQTTASDIFDLMEKFAGYGFNKAHSVAYALLTYQTAYLKTHYPAAFMMAVLSSDMDKTEKVVDFLSEAKKMQLVVRPPDINHSEYTFTLHKTTNTNEIIYGLGAIKGIGESAIALLLDNRAIQGKFTDFTDFCNRIDSRKVNRKTLEALIKSGSLDSLGLSRAVMMAGITQALQKNTQTLFQQKQKQKDLFLHHADIFDSEINIHTSYHNLNITHWTLAETLQAEKETLGFYQSGHPLESYQTELLPVIQSYPQLTLGLLSKIKFMQTKRGQRMAFLTLETLSNILEVTVFADAFEKNKTALLKDAILIIHGSISIDDFTGNEKLLAREIYTVGQFRAKYAKGVVLTLAHQQIHQGITFEKLAAILTQHVHNSNKKLPVFVDYAYQHATTTINRRFKLGKLFSVDAHDNVITALQGYLGQSNVNIIYELNKNC